MILTLYLKYHPRGLHYSRLHRRRHSACREEKMEVLLTAAIDWTVGHINFVAVDGWCCNVHFYDTGYTRSMGLVFENQIKLYY